jgi:3-hydroxyisobutyrate dehydrogenase-like beta-hydroxyacid dehydrogenase
MDVGFIGLGNMGSAIARDLIEAGHKVTVWNRTEARMQMLIDAGATFASSPAEAARAGMVMSMLADDEAVEAVTFGDSGIMSGLPAGGCHVSISTISVALGDRLASAHAEQGHDYLSAPVFGRPAAAAARKLFVVAGGLPAVVERCRPLFDAFAQRSFVAGERPGAANLVKLCGNFMIMAAIEAMAEAMTAAAKGGVDKAKLVEILTGTLFDAPVYRTYGEILVEERFRPAGFAAPLGLKDMRLMAAAAEQQRVPMPFLGVIHDHLLAAIAQEGEDVDWSGIALAVARNAGLQRPRQDPSIEPG